jgi:hypothetical protein
MFCLIIFYAEIWSDKSSGCMEVRRFWPAEFFTDEKVPRSRQKQPSLDLVGALDSPRIENMNVYKMELETAVLKVINDFMHCTIGNYSSA